MIGHIGAIVVGDAHATGIDRDMRLRPRDPVRSERQRPCRVIWLRACRIYQRNRVTPMNEPMTCGEEHRVAILIQSRPALHSPYARGHFTLPLR